MILGFERKFALWAKDLRAVQKKSELQDFLDEHFKPEKEALAARFEAGDAATS